MSEVSEEITTLIEGIAMSLIGQKGWTTENEILQADKLRFVGLKTFTEKQFKRMIGEMLDKYSLERARLNKQLKQELGVDVNGFPFVLTFNRHESDTKNEVTPAVVITPKNKKSTKDIISDRQA